MVTDRHDPDGNGGPPGVDPDALRRVASCTVDLTSHRSEMVAALHDRLSGLSDRFEESEEGGLAISHRFVSAVLYAAQTEVPSADIIGVVQRAGADSYLEGFSLEQYGSVTHAMLHAVRAAYGGGWSSALSSAWVEFLIWFRTTLLAGAEAQRAHEAARERAEANRAPDPPVRAESYSDDDPDDLFATLAGTRTVRPEITVDPSPPDDPEPSGAGWGFHRRERHGR
jgi:hypothetical protein